MEEKQYCNSFDNINLKDYTLRGIYAYGWEKPSDIQKQSLIQLLNGNDIMSLNIHGSNISKALTIAKNFWLENNFNCEKSQLINYLKKFSI